MTTTTCPRCGFVQEGGAECARCGVLFARAHRAGATGPRPTAVPAQTKAEPRRVSQPTLAEPPRRGWFGRAYRIFRWVALAVSLTALILMLRKSAPPEIQVDAAAPARAEAKMERAYAAAAAGRTEPVELDEVELNGWLHRNLALAPAAGSAPGSDASVEEMRSNVKDVKVQLVDDRVHAWVLFHVYGKDLTLTLEARLFAQNGSLRLQPTAGWLGSLPVPRSALDRGFARAFSDPANAEKFRLPSDVADVHVEGGRLVIVPAVGVAHSPAAGVPAQSYVPGGRPAVPPETAPEPEGEVAPEPSPEQGNAEEGSGGTQ
jgi:hypothetical protein